VDEILVLELVEIYLGSHDSTMTHRWPPYPERSLTIPCLRRVRWCYVSWNNPLLANYVTTGRPPSTIKRDFSLISRRLRTVRDGVDRRVVDISAFAALPRSVCVGQNRQFRAARLSLRPGNLTLRHRPRHRPRRLCWVSSPARVGCVTGCGCIARPGLGAATAPACWCSVADRRARFVSV
jgi:hypothetical protein